jgi:hypothetical protein
MGTIVQFPPAITAEQLAYDGGIVTMAVTFHRERPKQVVYFAARVSEPEDAADLTDLLWMITAPNLAPRMTPALLRECLTVANIPQC